MFNTRCGFGLTLVSNDSFKIKSGRVHCWTDDIHDLTPDQCQTKSSLIAHGRHRDIGSYYFKLGHSLPIRLSAKLDHHHQVGARNDGSVPDSSYYSGD